MSFSRRNLLSGSGAMMAATALPPFPIANPVRELFERSDRANVALMQGDLATYRSLIAYSDDFTLMSPFGGEPTHAAQITEERMQALGRFFRDGNGTMQKLVRTYASPEMIALVLIERSNVAVGGLPAQDWALRVTLIFRLVEGEWLLAHRHADPLVHGVTREEAAALARGD